MPLPQGGKAAGAPRAEPEDLLLLFRAALRPLERPKGKGNALFGLGKLPLDSGFFYRIFAKRGKRSWQGS